MQISKGFFEYNFSNFSKSVNVKDVLEHGREDEVTLKQTERKIIKERIVLSIMT